MKVFKRLLKIIVYTGISVLTLLAVLTVLTQTQFFKDRLRDVLGSTLTKQFNGRVTLGTIRGNFFSGFTIDSVGIYYQNQPVLHIGKITFAYHVLPLLEKKLRMSYLILEQPEIIITRSTKGDWNISRVLIPSADTTKAEFAWSGIVQNIELKHGTVTLRDSLETDGEDSAANNFFNYHSFSIHDINLKLGGSFRQDALSAHVVHGSCYSTRPRFDLTEFKGDFSLDDHGLRAENVIIQTSNSYLKLDAKLRSKGIIDISRLEDLEHDSTDLSLRASKIDFSELKELLPQVDFLNGSAYVDLKSSGDFGNLDIRQLDIRFSQTAVHISGNIRNLHKPNQLYLNAYIADSRIAPPDVAHLLREFNLPTFDSLGTTTISAHFIGKPAEFTTSLLLHGRMGSAEADAKLNFTDSIPHYDINFRTKALDLERIFGKASYSSSLTSHGTLVGEGVSLGSLRSALSITVDSSRLRQLTVDHAEAGVRAAGRQLDATATLNSSDARADLNAHCDLSHPDLPQFSSEVSLASFNLAPLLGNPSYKSDLTLRGVLKGSGSTIDNLSADFELVLLPSSFGSHNYHEDTLRLSIDQHTVTHKEIDLRSSIADIELNGSFDLDLASALIVNGVSNLLSSIRNHALPPDSVKAVHAPLAVKPHPKSQYTMNFDYRFHLRDLEPISTLLSTEHFDGNADLSGTVRTEEDNLSFTCNGNIGEFYLGSSAHGFILSNCAIALQLDSLRGEDILNNLSCSFEATIGSGDINAIHLDNAHCRFIYKDTRGHLALQGVFDSLYSARILAESSIQPGSYVFDVDTLSVHLGQFRWDNSQDVQFRINSEGTRVMHAEIVHNNALVSGTGALYYSGRIEGTITLHKFDLQELNLWLPKSRLQTAVRNFSGTADLSLQIGGMIDNPLFQVTLEGNHVGYRETPIGEIVANVSYRDTMAEIGLSIRGEGEDSLSSLQVQGHLPVNLSLSGVESRFPERSQDLVVTSSRFDLTIFDPLIGELDNLTGKLTGKIIVKGTPRYPQYTGSIQLRDVNFIFTPNNVSYSVNGDLEPDGNKLVLKNFVLKSPPIGGKRGEAQVSGSLTITDYVISSFDITAIGEILLMSDATRKIGTTLYGTLLTETDAAGLNLKGSFEHPFLTGKLFVLNANLIFPPTKPSTLSANQLSLNHIIVDDTTKKSTQIRKISKFYDLGTPESEHDKGNEPAQNILFVDRLRYNVSVETKGTTAIKMIFTPETNEELYSELEGKVSVVNNQGTPIVNGEITVLPHSYYNFFKRFDATGSLNFVGPWDNPDLKIQATYEDYHIIDSLSKSGSIYQEKVTIILDIRGNRYEPKLTMSMKIQPPSSDYTIDRATQANGGDVQSDVISFILTGKFHDELTSTDRRNLTSNVGATASAGFTSNLLSGILTNFLRTEFPFLRIRDASITYQGGTPDVRISGDVLQGYLQLGGRIFNNIANANLSYQVNLGDIFKNASIRNLFLEIQHRDSDLIEDRKTDQARIYYRFSF